MAGGETIRVEGLKELERHLGEASLELRAELRAAELEAAMLVARRANTYVNVGETGALARSIRARASKTGAAVTAGSRAVPYAAAIHWGWRSRNIVGTKFVVRALDDMRAKAQAVIEGKVAHILRRLR